MADGKSIVQIVVVVGVVKRGKKILLTVRRESKLSSAHLKLEFPGGKPKIGEDLAKAAEREVLEETGWKVKAIRKLPLVLNRDWDYGERIQQTIIHGFECRVIKKSSLKRKMHQDASWHELELISTLDCLPGTLDFVALLE